MYSDSGRLWVPPSKYNTFHKIFFYDTNVRYAQCKTKAAKDRYL